MSKLNQILFLSIIVLTFVRYCELLSLRRNSDLEHKKHQALSNYFCYQYELCKHDGKKICGFDEESSFLAVFEDHCTLLQVNCKGGGAKIFFQVEYQVCDVKTKYEFQYQNETSQFEHVTTTETPEPDEGSSVQYIRTTKKATTVKKSYPRIPKIKWKTKSEILSLLRRRSFYMPFLK